jgi:tetratricopeptide (TPR) repeat protein
MRRGFWVVALAALIPVVARADSVSDARGGQDALNRGDPSAAVALFTRAIDARGLSQDGQESAYVERATAYVSLRQFDLALADLDLAQLISANDPDARTLRAQIPQTSTLDQASAARRGATLYSRGDYDGAIAALDRSLDQKPDDQYSLYERGLTWIGKQDYPHAINDFTAVIRLAPDTYGAYDLRADAYRLQGSYDKALADYNQAIQLRPNDASGYFGRGQTAAEKRDAQSAIADYSKALQLQPNAQAYLYARCMVRAAASIQLDQALADCNQALSIYSNDPNVLDARGFVWFRRGQIDRAIADETAALQIDPRRASSLYVRGLAEEHGGQAAQAQTDIRAAQTLNPKVGDYYAKWGIRP